MRTQGSRLACAVVVIGVLAGCAGQPPTPTAPPSMSPNPEPVAEQPATPEPRLGFDCEAAAERLDVSSVLGGRASAIDPMIGSRGGVIESYARMGAVALEQAGGIWCAWEREGSQESDTFDVTLLPTVADVAWEARDTAGFVAVPVEGGEAWLLCGAELDCIADVYVAGTAARLGLADSSASVAPTDSTIAAVQRLADVIVESGPAAPLWVPPSATPSRACDALVPPGSDLPSVGPILASSDFMGSSDRNWVMSAAREEIGARECAWIGVSGRGAVRLLVIPGGGWAWASHAPQSNGSLTLAPQSGLGDAAFTGCAELIPDCVAHVRVGDDWLVVEAGLPPDESVDILSITRRLIGA